MQQNHQTVTMPEGNGDAWSAQSGHLTLSAEDERKVLIMMGLGDILNAEGDTSSAQPKGGQPGVGQHAPDYGQATPTPARAAQASAAAPCDYSGGACEGFSEEEMSRGIPGVRHHLWRYHRNHVAQDQHGKHICQWRTGTREVCSMAILDFDNLARHVASVHLRRTIQRCPRCGGQFSRMDALLRHYKTCA